MPKATGYDSKRKVKSKVNGHSVKVSSKKNLNLQNMRKVHTSSKKMGSGAD